MSDSNINLPRRTRGDLVAAARQGVKPEDFEDFESKRRKKHEAPRTLTAPVERKTGGVHRVEIDTEHFNVLQTIALLAERWSERLEATGLPAMQPREWELFVEAIRGFRNLQSMAGNWVPGEASAVLDLLQMRSDLADGG